MLTELFLMFAAFFLGCIVTEIRWIGKMRRLRHQVEAEMAQTEKAVSANVADAGSEHFKPHAPTQEGLLGLQQHLSETEESPVPQSDLEV